MRGCGLTKAVGSLIVMCCLLRRNYEWRVHALSQFTCMGGFIGADRPRKRQRNGLGDVSGGRAGDGPLRKTGFPWAGSPTEEVVRILGCFGTRAQKSREQGGPPLPCVVDVKPC